MSRRTDAWKPQQPLPSFDWHLYPDATLDLLRTGWRQLCENERDSVIAATLVSVDLARLGAPPEILGDAARIIEDEIRHVEVCIRVLDQLGVFPTKVAPALRRQHATEPCDLETSCAQQLLAGFAVSEAMSAACFAACRRETRNPLIRWALTEILRDEVGHGAFGLRAGSWVIAGWDSPRRAALWPRCVAEMEAFERAIGGPIPEGALSSPIDPSLSLLGVLPAHMICEAALACLPRWVLRPLAALGIWPINARTV